MDVFAIVTTAPREALGDADAEDDGPVDALGAALAEEDGDATAELADGFGDALLESTPPETGEAAALEVAAADALAEAEAAAAKGDGLGLEPVGLTGPLGWLASNAPGAGGGVVEAGLDVPVDEAVPFVEPLATEAGGAGGIGCTVTAGVFVDPPEAVLLAEEPPLPPPDVTAPPSDPVDPPEAPVAGEPSAHTGAVCKLTSAASSAAFINPRKNLTTMPQRKPI